MKKEIIFFSKDANLSNRGGFYNKIIIQQGISKIMDGSRPDLDITSYDFSGDSCWSIWTIRKSYDLFDLEKNRFCEFSKELFLYKIKFFYPDDFLFFVWNPEIFDGIYNEITEPEPETQSISQNGA